MKIHECLTYAKTYSVTICLHCYKQAPHIAIQFNAQRFVGRGEGGVRGGFGKRPYYGFFRQPSLSIEDFYKELP